MDFEGAVSGFCLPIGGYFGSFLRFSRQIAWLSSFEKRGKRQCKPSAMQTELVRVCIAEAQPVFGKPPIPRNSLPMSQTNKFKQLLNVLSIKPKFS